MRRLLALCGPQGCGKSTLAELLSRDKNFIKMRFAAPLKNMLSAFLFNQGLELETIHEMLDGKLKEEPHQYLNGRTPRHAMQTLGTEWRDLIHRNLWIDAWERQCKNMDYDLVVEDLRFLHEADRVGKLGGKVILISRSGYGSGEHLSEREYLQIKPDAIVVNDGAPKDMLRQLIYILDVEVP